MSNQPETPENILVIKLGALGDFIQALGPMKAIREHHKQANITLLTTQPYESLGITCNYFDQVWVDDRPKLIQFKQWMALRDKLKSGHFNRVYDLQNNDRTSFYLRLFGWSGKPEWVGAAFGASHRNTSKQRTAGLAFEGHKQTLALAGIENVHVDDLSWVQNDISKLALKTPFVLLAPGSSPERIEKRWPADSYGILARKLSGWGFTPVVVGTQKEAGLGEHIVRLCPEAINLCGQTAILDLAVIARRASAAIGNDSGPMHIVGQTGCPTYVLFSKHSDPKRHRPLGPKIETLQSDYLHKVSVDDVLRVLKMRDFVNREGQDSQGKYHTELSK